MRDGAVYEPGTRLLAQSTGEKKKQIPRVNDRKKGKSTGTREEGTAKG
jgi:hypothetical protein